MKALILATGLSLASLLNAVPSNPQDDAGAKSAPATDAAWSDPYTLETCPISGKKLGSMGDPVVKEYEGREVRFCCSGCVKPFEADPAAAWKKIDEAIIADQLRYYPLETCLVTGEPLVNDGKDTAENFVFGNRLVRLCCGACEREFRASPKKFIDALNVAATAAQRKAYPLETCVVSTGPLGSMGEPTERVVAGRLMRFCCAGCEPKVERNPVKYLQTLDAAWQAKGMYLPAKSTSTPDAEDRESEHGGRDSE